MKLNGTKARGDSEFDTIWDRKRSEISEQEWIVSPLAAQADVVMADDKVRLKPIITLEKITRRPLALTLASQNPQNRNFDMVNVWLPNIASYDTGSHKSMSSKEYLTPTIDGNNIDAQTGQKLVIDETLIKASQRMELIQKRRPNSPIVVFKSHNKNTKNRENKGAKQQRKQVPKVVIPCQTYL